MSSTKRKMQLTTISHRLSDDASEAELQRSRRLLMSSPGSSIAAPACATSPLRLGLASSSASPNASLNARSTSLKPSKPLVKSAFHSEHLSFLQIMATRA